MISEIRLFLQNNPSLTERDVNEKLRPLVNTFMELMELNRISIVNGTPLKRISLSNEIDIIKDTLGMTLSYSEAYSFILRYGRSLIK